MFISPRHLPGRRNLAPAAIALFLLTLLAFFTLSASNAAAIQSAAPTASGIPSTPTPAYAPQSPGQFYGLWVLLPALLAIALAMISRQVLLALPLGILCAGIMYSIASGIYHPIDVLTFTIDRYLFGVLFPHDFSDPHHVADLFKHVKTLVVITLIGAMIGVVEANGGTRAMVDKVTHLMRTRRRGQLGALLAGIVIFFDDYANALIVGPSMRPVFDRLKLSRAKLAYIVDSTSAPVASLFIGTWLAAEINFLDTALTQIGDHRPAFLKDMTGSTAFWGSLPYRTYAILAIIFVFIIAVLGKDFGPMKKAEAQALAADPIESTDAPRSDGRLWPLGFFPVFTLVAMCLGLLLWTGYKSCSASETVLAFDSFTSTRIALQNIFGSADTYLALIYSALAAAVLAILLTLLSRTISLAATFDGASKGMNRVFGAQLILILAWGLSAATKDLELGQVAGARLKDLVDADLFSVQLLPAAIFIAACIVSFSTGTSYGTMSILCPTAVTIAARLLADMPPDQAMPLFYACVGAVLAGAVFGDHCSPISDTTVLSALSSDCPLEAHVRTQLPYALLTAIVGLLCTDLLRFALSIYYPNLLLTHWSAFVYYGTALAILILLLFVLLFGRRAQPIPFIHKLDIHPA